MHVTTLYLVINCAAATRNTKHMWLSKSNSFAPNIDNTTTLQGQIRGMLGLQEFVFEHSTWKHINIKWR